VNLRHLRVELADAVATITLDRPPVNAVNLEVIADFLSAVTGLADDPAVRAVVITGIDGRFCAGADIAMMRDVSRVNHERVRRWVDVQAALEASSKPVIAAINGYAFGGGCELALACHVRLASENAVLGLPEVSLGIIPGYGGTQRLPRLVGKGRALELILTGRRVKADEAERMGLVNRVVPRADLLGEAEKLAQAILENGPLAVSAALEAVHRGLPLGLDDGQRLESGLFGLLAASQDMHEGMKAFLEKRPARFERR